MKKIVLLILLAIISISAVSYFLFKPATKGIEATVARIVDGDTIELANHDIVRLIGIDAPEKDQPYYDQIIEQLRKLEGKAVRMEKDKTNKDRYGRYLRYVFVDDNFVNLELVRNGLAYVYIVSPDKKYEKEFLEAENSARSNDVGIWDESEYSDCIELEQFHYNARGEDNKNISDEFFVISNSCDTIIYAEDWSVRNSYNAFKIPNFSLEPKLKIKIISGEGKSNEEEIFLSSKRPIWNNKRDSLHLRDGSGKIILSRSYKND